MTHDTSKTNVVKLYRPISNLAAAVAAMLFMGCASTENPALTQAEQAYHSASSDAALMKHEKAAAYMETASTTLAAAKHEQQLIASFNEPIDPQQVDAKAHVVEQNVRAALEIAARDTATAELAKLTAERDAAKLAKNERDAAALAARQEQDRAGKALADALERAREAGAEIDQSSDGLRVTFRNMTFDTNQASLKPQFKPTLDELAAALAQRYPTATVQVNGYTDSTGPEAYNAQLSEKRAIAVQTFLIDQGIASDRIASKGLGEQNPVASNDTAEGRALNRRVELVVSGGENQ